VRSSKVGLTRDGYPRVYTCVCIGQTRKPEKSWESTITIIPFLLSAQPDGDDPTPDNWILFPAKKPGRSVADDECNPVRFPRTRTLALFLRTRVSSAPLSFCSLCLLRTCLSSLYLFLSLSLSLSLSLFNPFRVFLRAPWFFSHSTPRRISSIRLIVRRDEKKRGREKERERERRRKIRRPYEGQGSRKGAKGKEMQ